MMEVIRVNCMSTTAVHPTLPLLSDERTRLPVQAREDQNRVNAAPPGQNFYTEMTEKRTLRYIVRTFD
jgi:hypothetical protein